MKKEQKYTKYKKLELEERLEEIDRDLHTILDNVRTVADEVNDKGTKSRLRNIANTVSYVIELHKAF